MNKFRAAQFKVSFLSAPLFLIVFFGGVPEMIAGEKVGRSKCDSVKHVLVELFTSEGCSSCPPADLVLTRLEKEQPVPGVRIDTLSESVPYWNYLGWRDPYASELFTQRQKAYAEALRKTSLYTPQMVVDGQAELLGSDFGQALTEIQRASKFVKAKIRSSGRLTGGALRLKGEMNLPQGVVKGDFVVRLAVVEDNLSSPVTRGENAGRKLLHNSIVRTVVDLVRVTDIPVSKFEKTITLDAQWKERDLRAIVFAQDTKNQHIVGSAECALDRTRH